MALLRFDAVSKNYPGGHAALTDVGFSVDAGEMVFITGHSGAGKSTLLRLIHLSERPTRGTVLVSDRNLAKVRGRQVALHRWRGESELRSPRFQRGRGSPPNGCSRSKL